ncbi:hypothetical protein IX83_04525 [Basilea psittacipulmonis DSM 24701]|uniref:Recombinase n=1 Tax=Basilea psittacipulmonis DSM 24701 TaxID=1072685 RepID=A0A077DHQ1_9BURK|nr:hypothetical protein IX83_04525 [Basilea psittacipulmonis DSM 24701]
MRKATAVQLVQILAQENRPFVEKLSCFTLWFRKQTHTEKAFDELIQALYQQTEDTEKLATAFYEWVSKIRWYPSFVSMGLFSREGLFKDMVDIIYRKINPPPRSADSLQDVLSIAFDWTIDQVWLDKIQAKDWTRLYLILSRSGDHEKNAHVASLQFCNECLYAMEMLSIWIAAEELDPDLLRLDACLQDVDSPFVALHREITLFVHSFHEHMIHPDVPLHDNSHALVMIEQSQELITRLKKRGIVAGTGSSMKVSYLLERLEQTLWRLKDLLDIQTTDNFVQRNQMIQRLSYEFIRISSNKKTLGQVWKTSTRMLSQSITQNKSDHGEHYITQDSTQYWRMFRSAAGAGVIIALMALLKIYITGLGLSKFQTAVLVSLNYGLGFMLVHILRFTIATKQPAMTATSVALAVQKTATGSASQHLSQLLIDVNRSQSIAVIGNVSIAILVACFLSLGFAYFSQGINLIDQATAEHLVQMNEPISGLALFYAAIAAIWLFCSGIITGFFDNRADYLELNKRIEQHPILNRLLGHRICQWLGNYLHEHYGSLIGNFSFGVLLGMTGYIGYLTGLPLDIRHVAFSSANLGYAATSQGMSILMFILNLLFVLMIGLVNLWVSFALALVVALRARDAHIGDIKGLMREVIRRIIDNPISLIYPHKMVLIKTDNPLNKN